MATHGCAEAHHRCNAGLSAEGSERVPALITNSPGMVVTALYSAEPQVLQKNRLTGSLLLPLLEKLLRLRPATSKPSAGTSTLTEKALPDCFWQSLQWQTAVISGAAGVE
ncbi:hypothetical protein D3C85_948180 [compost metagenome]